MATAAIEALLVELVDCEERKARKKLAKQALELLKQESPAPAEEEAPSSKKDKKKKKEEVEEAAPVSSSKKDEKKKKKRDLEEAQQTDKQEPAAAIVEETTNGEQAEEESYYYPEEKKRFSRIKDEQKSFQEALIQDNTYDAVFAGTGYGAKANDKLKTVRGKDFRHEKTKKKRGSYKGGPIDDEVVNSVEFSD